MKYIEPVTFENNAVKTKNPVKDFRPKAVGKVDEDDPKDLSAQASVNELPPGMIQSPNTEPLLNTGESSTPVVPQSQLENSLQDVWENDANAGKEEKELDQN